MCCHWNWFSKISSSSLYLVVVLVVVVHTTTFAKWAFAKSTEFRNMSTTQDQHVPHSILAKIGFLM